MSADLLFQTWAAGAIDAQFAIDGLTAVGVYAHPLPDAPLPYIDIGESYITDAVDGHEVFMTIHTWSKAEGSHDAKNIQASLRKALHAKTASFDIWRFTCIREETSRVILDRDGEHWHGITTIRCMGTLL
jgi:hypothetical protein